MLRVFMLYVTNQMAKSTLALLMVILVFGQDGLCILELGMVSMMNLQKLFRLTELNMQEKISVLVY